MISAPLNIGPLTGERFSLRLRQCLEYLADREGLCWIYDLLGQAWPSFSGYIWVFPKMVVP